MRGTNRRAGITVVEVLIIGVVLAAFGAMLMPAVQFAREATRRQVCADNLKAIGLAFHNYAQVNKVLPSASTVSRNADGSIAAIDGWSWLVQMLPFMDDSSMSQPDRQKLYDSLDIENGRPLDKSDAASAAALAVSLPELLCPSYGGSAFADPQTNREAITNYRPFGATHIESLSVASANPMTPKYAPTPRPGKRQYHPDGACFPGKYRHFAEIRDGTSNTLLASESIEPLFARWTVGAEAAVVGLPRNVEFHKIDNSYSIKGLDLDGTVTDSLYWTYRTYLDWDCDKNPYDGKDGSKWGKFGPSSHHPGVAHHLFMDGSVVTLHKEIDVASYVALITADGRVFWY